MIAYKEIENTNIAEIMIEGKVSEDEFDMIAPKIKSFIDRKGKIRVVEEVKDFEGVELSSIWDHMKLHLSNMKDVERVALISDNSAIRNASKLTTLFTSGEVKTYESHQRAEAHAWVR